MDLSCWAMTNLGAHVADAVARLDKGDGNVIAFDPVRGLDLTQPSQAPQRPLGM